MAFDPRTSKYDPATLKSILTNAPLMSKIHQENINEYRELVALGAQLGIGAGRYFVAERDLSATPREGLRTPEQIAALQEFSEARCVELFKNDPQKNPIGEKQTGAWLKAKDPAAYYRAQVAAQARGFNVVPAPPVVEEKRQVPTDESIEFSPEMCQKLGLPVGTRAPNFTEWGAAITRYQQKQIDDAAAAATSEAA